MPRLPSTSCAPRPTRASRTRVFTGWVSGSGEGRGLAERRSAAREEERGGARSAAGQQPGQQAVQTRSRSTWIRPTRSTVVAATGQCLPDRWGYAQRRSRPVGRPAPLQAPRPRPEARRELASGEEDGVLLRGAAGGGGPFSPAAGPP